VNTTQTTGPFATGFGGCATKGSCSLPQAINSYNADTTGNDVIDFSVHGVFGLGAKLFIANSHAVPLSIVGDGGQILSGQQTNGIFDIEPGGGAVLMSDLTLENGSSEYGGAIENFGSLTLLQVTVKDSFALAGGGIDNENALTLRQSTIEGNQAAYEGGGIFNNGTLTLYQSTVTGNQAGSAGGGGGIYEDGGTVQLTQSSVVGNQPDDIG
jgi:hypothetical protein